MWLFPLIFAVVQFTPPVCKNKLKASNTLLLLVSYSLYIQCKPIYALILLYVTAVTYIGARWVIGDDKRKNRHRLIAVLATLALLPLGLFKYYNFINSSLTSLFAAVGWDIGLPGLNWAVPLGISFFSFQAVGYLFDVYYRRIKAECNWWHYMLFVSFFPQIASGPISKAGELLPQIKTERVFSYPKAVQGCKWLLWGMFLKVVVADRVGQMADTILPNYAYVSGLDCALGSILYSVQIYGDFAGYSLMAVGVGRLTGFDLINNFRRPYFAASVTEFWRRWHISLTRWLTDYVYIPLGGNRCSRLRNYYNITVTFLVSGIWHGANFTFIVWGLVHGMFQIAEKALGWQKCETGWLRPFRILFTFLVVTLAWVFFRMPTVADGWGVVSKIFTNHDALSLRGTKTDILFVFASVFVLWLAEWMEEYHPKFSLLNGSSRSLRWCTYIALLVSIAMCGVLDAGSFIYVNF